jgi:hypothetical protein
VGFAYQTSVALTHGRNYKFKVVARNSVGKSIESSEFAILAAQAPDQP